MTKAHLQKTWDYSYEINALDLTYLLGKCAMICFHAHTTTDPAVMFFQKSVSSKIATATCIAG
jgi:hypothetical protein